MYALHTEVATKFIDTYIFYIVFFLVFSPWYPGLRVLVRVGWSPPPSIDLRPFVGNTVPIEGKKCAHTHTSTKKIISRTIQLGTGRPSTVGRSWNSDRISFSLVVIFGKFLVGSVGISFVRFPSLLLLPHFVL